MGTLFYILVATRRKSPVFLGSSFAFISPLASAVAYGFGGILLAPCSPVWCTCSLP